MDTEPITVAGAKKLQDELNDLINNKRQKVIQAIAEAREHGDLKENAEYHAAKERSAQINGRMRMLEYHLAHAVVIDPATVKSEKVAFGATVTLTDLDSDEVVVYSIVGEDEADAERGLINVNSPIARAMIGKSEGDEVLVKLPRGDREFELMSLEFKPVS